MILGNIHSVETFGAVDGPGIRYVVFFQGCRLRCLYCHNPDTWNLSDGKLIDADSLVQNIVSYKNFLSGGVTLSGGEPFLQPDFACAVLEKCRKHGLHTAVDTAGSVELSVSKPVIDRADMILLDIKADTHDGYETITGSREYFSLATQTLEYCESINKPVWIRHVLLPQYTLFSDRLENLAKLLSPYKCIEKVELLPFHKLGEHKWQTLGAAYKLYNTEIPSDFEINSAEEIFRSHGLTL